MEFKEAMKIWHRMCHKQENCVECPFFSDDNGQECMEYMLEHTDEAEQILEEWDEKNPAITNALKFKEVFGLDVNESITNPGYFYIPEIVNPITTDLSTISLDDKIQMLNKINNWLDAEYKEEN